MAIKNKYIGSYEGLGQRVGALVDKKQVAYGDSFGRSGAVLHALYPAGIPAEQYDDMLAIVRIVDKLFRIATHGGKDPMAESPFLDIAGYGLLGARRHEMEQSSPTEGDCCDECDENPVLKLGD